MSVTEDLPTGSGAPRERDRTLEESIGLQVRNMRRRANLTVRELASAAGISTSMLSKIENGQITASLHTLQALAQAHNVPLSQLFQRFEEQHDCSYVPAGQGLVIERRGTKAGHKYELLGHALGGDVVVEPYMITLHENAEAYTGFQHAGTEFIYMISGEVLYRHGGTSYHLRPGDSLLFDSGAPHGPEELLSRPISYLSIITYHREEG